MHYRERKEKSGPNYPIVVINPTKYTVLFKSPSRITSVIMMTGFQRNLLLSS